MLRVVMSQGLYRSSTFFITLPVIRLYTAVFEPSSSGRRPVTVRYESRITGTVLTARTATADSPNHPCPGTLLRNDPEDFRSAVTYGEFGSPFW